MAGAGVIAMAMSDHRTPDRPHRVDVEVPGRAIEAGRLWTKQGFGSDHWADIGAISSRRRRCL